MVLLNADGLYISAFNKDLRLSRFKNSKYKIIGSIHNIKELNIKINQGCTYFLFSRLFGLNMDKYSQKIINFGNSWICSRKTNLIILNNNSKYTGHDACQTD